MATNNKELLDTVEKTLDLQEEALDKIENASNVVSRRPALRVAIVSAVALGAGAGIAWFVAKNRYEAKYAKIAEREIAEAKAFYSRLYKKDEYATPGETAEALGVGGTEAAVALERYGAKKLAEVAVEVTETTEVEVSPVTTNVFDNSESDDDVWDQDKEEAYRASIGDDEPYVISHMEYNENENDYQQTSLTYFVEDDVLVDEKETPIDAVDMVVGEGNLTRFGHGVMDNRIVFVRNDKLGMDFEIVKNDGSYSKLVLGFQHSDKPQVRKFRGGDE